jgi:hypothetical protein
MLNLHSKVTRSVQIERRLPTFSKFGGSRAHLVCETVTGSIQLEIEFATPLGASPGEGPVSGENFPVVFQEAV